MNLRYLFQLLVVIGLILCYNITKASHIIGGELTYRCTGNSRYEIFLTIYSDCGSQAILERYYPINYYATDLGIEASNPLSFNVYKSSVEEVPLACSSAVTTCNGGTALGVQKVVYRGVVNLQAYEPSEDWRFFWQRAARSEMITNLITPQYQDFFIEASINTQKAACNNSVTFSGPALVNACSNQEYTFNNGAVDPDGDELRYALATPKVNYNTEVVYSSAHGYNATNFMIFQDDPVFNPNSGDLTFNILPSAAYQVGITDYKVEEYRNGELIGWVRRGIQVTSIDCENKLPEISDFKEVSSDSYSVCAGESINLSFDVSDEDMPAGIKVSLLSGPLRAFMVANNDTPNPQGRIIWNTSVTDAGEYQFVVQASDNYCPIPGITTKTFTVTVNSAPVFDLGKDELIACDDRVLLDPAINGGQGNYDYKWSNGSTEATLEAQIGGYGLIVTDEIGCSYKDSINFENEILVNFGAIPRCAGIPVNFSDSSVHRNSAKKIVGWSWDFGDGGTSNLQNPEHTFAKADIYDVTLTVTDDSPAACTNSFTKQIIICDPPEFSINLSGHCTYEALKLFVLPVSDTCSFLDTLIYDLGDTVIRKVKTDSLFYQVSCSFNKEGDYPFTVTGISSSGCENVKTVTFHIDPSPVVRLRQNSFYLKCSSPDSLLQSFIIQEGTGALQYEWNNGLSTPDIWISSSGDYSVTVTDEVGCTSSDGLRVTYPLRANFSYDPYCEAGDVIQFHDKTVEYVNTITSYSWDFDDPASGANNTSSVPSPKHDFTNERDYAVTLVVKDDDGCESFTRKYVYNTSIDNNYQVTPASGEICLGDFIGLEGPQGPHIDKYTYDFKDTLAFDTLRVLNYMYDAPGEYDIDLKVRYNFNNDATGSCETDFSKKMIVHENPEVEIKASQDRFCKGDEIIFNYESTKKIQSVEWDVYNQKSGVHFISTDNELIYTFKERAQFSVTLTATDINGCTDTDRMSGFADELSEPSFLVEDGDLCAKVPVLFKENFRDEFENITDYRWDFGDGEILEGQVPFPMITHSYQRGGQYWVTLTVINRFSGCEKTTSAIPVNIKFPPHIDFEFDEGCERSPVPFTNTTTPGDGEIATYQWIFPDGTTSNEENPSHIFENSGTYPVSLVSSSTIGCFDTLTQRIYIKPSPRAGVEVQGGFVEAFIPFQFYDDSEGDIISYYWDFGDGGTSEERDPIHTYDAITKYPLTHIVTNTYECQDTLIVLLDLNVYLDIPTAFSPNDDGKNDEFRLIQQGIKKLHTFKIYNRHGQVVFDAGGDVNAVWDGTYNDRAQPAGVYIAHVQASGAYDTYFNFKKNITLLR
ncbi:PKD domain-containing protein [Fulvivirga sediminis]|uniref:PKD domain-containing protein n=1 Tax=Fulvivirga sediminis TaxID=2803949 RepID=A0A937F759_9BACT|nr:PKD domain-containing protein [Fulvivirga sediminis]MBL3657606.1 PKD domain-containing protein [Fulvivirga sediminis]